MDEPITKIRPDTPPYKPSWIDRFNAWTETLPIGAWIFYVAVGLVLVLIQILFLWLESGAWKEEILPVIIYNGLVTPFLLGLNHLLDNQAVSALYSMRSVLDTTEPEFREYEYKLSTMPSLPSLIAGLIMLTFVIFMERITTVPLRYANLEGLPIFAVVFYIIDKSSAYLFGVFIYHTIRQLKLVNAINTKHIRINLFNLRPLSAFSRLTSSTAVGLVVGVYGWMLINPDLLSDPINNGFVLIITILAATVFIWPLYGVHRLMAEAKETALREIDLQFEDVFSKFNQRYKEDDHTIMDRLNGTISSLDIQYQRIEAIATWPWRPETVRTVLTALGVPLVLMILQLLVEKTFN